MTGPNTNDHSEIKYRVLILYTEVMGYTMASIEALVRMYPVYVYVVGWDKGKLTPYKVGTLEDVEYHTRSSFGDYDSLLSYAIEKNPDLLFVSGWMDKDYVKVARYFKSRSIRVVSFLDNQWHGTLRQRAGQIFSNWMLKRNFSHLWVSGPKQHLFANKMGYDDKYIKEGFYSADTENFHQVRELRLHHIEQYGYPLNITYLGRFSEVKNIDILINVFKQNTTKWKGWTLTLIGAGPLKNEIDEKCKGSDTIIIKDFIQPGLLNNEMMRTGIFCLPSKNEPWGVVIHEFAAAGIPMIVSNVCGAAVVFLDEGNNGYSFNPSDPKQLEEKLDAMISMPLDQLKQMGEKSYQLSKKITPLTWATTVMEFLENH